MWGLDKRGSKRIHLSLKNHCLVVTFCRKYLNIKAIFKEDLAKYLAHIHQRGHGHTYGEFIANSRLIFLISCVATIVLTQTLGLQQCFLLLLRYPPNFYIKRGIACYVYTAWCIFKIRMALDRSQIDGFLKTYSTPRQSTGTCWAS